jgi:ribonuclease HII
MMNELDKKYPMYGFKRNKGYPTKEHLEALNLYGITSSHRKTYGPVSSVIEKNNN